LKCLGVDVGLGKGLDLVLLDSRRAVLAVERRLAHERLREVVLRLAPDAVAIDSPPRWASPAGARETERAVRRLGIQLYATPAPEKRSARGFHDWMAAGMAAFDSIADLYPLYDGGSPSRKAMEVFPHATAVVLAGALRPQGLNKHLWRRGVLERHGVDALSLRSPDLVDAALAALTGLLALEGRSCWLGLADEGVIVLPCLEAELPARFRREEAP
jgi:predicted nuclease with RNAse H fold